MSPRSLNPTELDALDALLTDIEADLDAGDLDAARGLLNEAQALAGPEHPDVFHAQAMIAWEKAGPAAARPFLERAVAAAPEHADARHALGIVCEAVEDFDGMVEQFLAVRELDTRADRKAGVGSKSELDFIERVAEEVLEGVPEEFAERLRGVPIVLEPRPSQGIVAEGFDPRAFGLFEGLEDGQSDGLALAPTRIVLFCSNLLTAFPDDDDLAEQIEITILHEVGHFFGLDEDGVARLGLE
jgi:predicted Zn-dependent protease with MMP-like domain